MILSLALFVCLCVCLIMVIFSFKFFFDKSICYIKRRKRGATLSTLGVYKRDQGEKENNVRKSTKLIAPGASQPVVQEKE
jgi:hypothetical protein